MGDKTGIEWTDATWNPTTGCDRVSAGCDHCYAMTLAPRLKAMGSAHYQTDGDPKTSGPGFGIAMHPDALDKPLRWTRPRMIFVNSMSDLFHDGVTDEFIAEVFAVMAIARQHTFQVLTKRHARMRSLLTSPRFFDLVHAAANARLPEGTAAGHLSWPLPNVWLGVSVENQQWADIRIPALLGTPAAVRFLSCEPLLGPVDLDPKWLNGQGDDEDCACRDGSGCSMIDWIIVGGESGPGARPMHPQWARDLRDQCTEAGVAFLFKQWGDWSPNPDSAEDPDAAVCLDGRVVWPGDSTWVPDYLTAVSVARVGKKTAGRVLDGVTHDGYPEVSAGLR